MLYLPALHLAGVFTDEKQKGNMEGVTDASLPLDTPHTFKRSHPGRWASILSNDPISAFITLIVQNFRKVKEKYRILGKQFNFLKLQPDITLIIAQTDRKRYSHKGKTACGQFCGMLY